MIINNQTNKTYSRRHLEKKRFFFYVLPIFVLITSFIFFVHFRFEARKDIYVNGRLERLEFKLYNTTKSLEKFANYTYETAINKDEVKELVYKAWLAKPSDRYIYRDQLYNLFLPENKNIEKFLFKQIHFHLPDSTSFLRVHDKEKYGDDLKIIRPSVKEVNTKKLLFRALN